MSELEQQVIQSQRMQAELESYGSVLVAASGNPAPLIGEVIWLDDTISAVAVVITKKSSWKEWKKRGKRMPDPVELDYLDENFEPVVWRIYEAVAE